MDELTISPDDITTYDAPRVLASFERGEILAQASAGTSKSHTHGQFKTAHLGLVVRAWVGYLESVAFRCRAVTLD